MTPKQTAQAPESRGPSLTDRLAHLDREKFARNMLVVAGQSQRLFLCLAPFAGGTHGNEAWGAIAAPLHFRLMPDTGACGKTWVVPHSRRPKARWPWRRMRS